MEPINLSDNPDEFINEIEVRQDDVWESITSAIKVAFENDTKDATIINVGEFYKMIVERRNWITTLKSAIDYYERYEEYEKCSLTKKLIEDIDKMLNNG